MSKAYVFKSLLFAIAVFAALATTAGCNPNVRITGRVTYEDGTPLSTGKIYFTDDFVMGRSDIDKNGYYSIHMMNKNDGIPKGNYNVYITSCFNFSGEGDSHKSEYGDIVLSGITPLIDYQYMLPDTSGWYFEVTGNTNIDLVVYPPGKVPEEERNEKAKYFFDEEYRKKVDKEKAREQAEEAKEKKRRRVHPSLL